MILNQKKEDKMRNVKDMKNDEIQDYINTHNHMKLDTTRDLFISLNNYWNILDNKKLLTKVLPRLLKPKPHEIRLVTDEWNIFDHHLAFNCLSNNCPIVNNEADCKNCSCYKKYPKIKQAYEEAVRIRALEIEYHVSCIDYSCWKHDRKFFIKDNNRDLLYIVNSCSESSEDLNKLISTIESN